MRWRVVLKNLVAAFCFTAWIVLLTACVGMAMGGARPIVGAAGVFVWAVISIGAGWAYVDGAFQRKS